MTNEEMRDECLARLKAADEQLSHIVFIAFMNDKQLSHLNIARDGLLRFIKELTEDQTAGSGNDNTRS